MPRMRGGVKGGNAKSLALITMGEQVPKGKPFKKPSTTPVTIHDVAARAGVAISSISRVLSGHPDVSERMRVKVLKAADDLGYEPDFFAQSLRSGATKTIGFIIRDISNPFFGVIAQCCEQELRKAGYSMLLMNSDGDVATENTNIAQLRRRKIDGLIASLVSEDVPELKGSLEKLNAPVVLLDRELAGFNSSAILTNHHQGIEDATADLISRGHARIAFISGSTRVYTTRDRLRGFKSAFKKAGVGYPIDLVSLGKFDAEFGESETKRLFTLRDRPTALISGGIGSTAGAMRGLKKLGLVPGKDLAFIAIDEWPMFDVFGQQYSSVYRDAAMIGREAAAALLEMMNGGSSRTIIVETAYIVRESSGGGLKVKKK